MRALAVIGIGFVGCVFLPCAAHALPSHFEIDPWSGVNDSEESAFPSLSAPALPAGRWAYTGDLFGFYNDLDPEQIRTDLSPRLYTTSHPHLFSTGHELRAAPNPSLELALGYDVMPGVDYEGRVTNRFFLEKFEQYRTTGKFFAGDATLYGGFLEKRHESVRTKNGFGQIFSLDINSHYEHAVAGAVWLPGKDGFAKPAPFPSGIAPSLAGGQQEYGLEQVFRKGTAHRYAHEATGTDSDDHHLLQPNFSVEGRWGRGIGFWQGEIRAGMRHTLPLNYTYRKKFTSLATGNWTSISADYEQDEAFEVPLEFRAKPSESLAILVGSDMKHIRQRSDVDEAAVTGDPVNPEEPSVHSYFQWDPEVRAAWWGHEPGAGLAEMGDLAGVHGPMLKQNQYLIEAGVRRAVTTRLQEHGRDTQNLINPHHIFQYPMDRFVESTEYAQYDLASSEEALAEIGPQNFWRTYGQLTYGVSDALNLSAGAGHQSRDGIHQFALPGRRTVYTEFHDFWFFTAVLSWRLSSRAVIEATTYWVPSRKETTRRYLSTGIADVDFTHESSYITETVELDVVF